MKKINNLAVLAIVAISSIACSNSGGEKLQTSKAVEVKDISFDQRFVLKPEESILAWEGYKPTGQHQGTVDIKDGNLMLVDGKIKGGQFSFDLSTITTSGMNDPVSSNKLIGHLKSADFFDVQNFPEATFEIAAIEPIEKYAISNAEEKGELIPTHRVTGNLTMKGITHSITFNARIEQSEDQLTAETNMFFIDRTEWNIQYKSKKISDKFKDDFINDEMGIRLKIVTVPENDEMASL